MFSRASRISGHLVLIAFLAGLALSSASTQHASGKVEFGRDVQPILKQFCVGCHGASQQMHGLRLDRRRDAMRGGTGTVIAPGNSAGSRLYLKLIGDKYGPQMPPTGPLPQEQIEVIKAWIDQGAEWPDELSGDVPIPPADPKAEPILKALRDGDKEALKRLIVADKDAGNRRGRGGITPLMQAVLYGDTDSIRLLLNQGADPNIRNDVGATALMWAVDDVEKTRLLLEHGADVNARSDDARTPVLIASGLPGNTEIVKLLLDRGADLSAKSPVPNGYVTLLAEAGRESDDAMMRMLVERGADPKGAGAVALSNAARSDCAKCLEILINAADRGTLTRAAIGLSPPFGDARFVKPLLEKGVDPNAREPKGNTLLMLAASCGESSQETVKALIERGADVNAKNPDGKTALDLARLNGPNPTIDILAKAGAREFVAVTDKSPVASPAASIRVALARSIPLLQKADTVFLEKAGCVSCHHNTFTSITVSLARRSGFAVDEQRVRDRQKKIGEYIETWRERALQQVGIPGESSSVSNILVGLAAENYAPDAATDALARYLLLQQSSNGQWHAFGHRPPMASSDIQVTATALKSIRFYGQKAQRARYDQSIRRATDWLIKVEPHTTDERVFQLLGLSWCGVKADNEIVKRRVRELLDEQRPDGGWAQLASLGSDAYATGQALVALRQAGNIAASKRAVKQGIEFLLKKQLADGSWYIRSRAIPLQPYFEGGFPHGHDQWISAAGTNWASMALALCSDSQNSTKRVARHDKFKPDFLWEF